MARRGRAPFTPEPPIYRFRVQVLGSGMFGPVAEDAWRDIELAANQTMADFGNAIPLAFDFDLDHLWSFFLSGKRWDTASAYALIPKGALNSDEVEKAADEHLLRDVRFPRKPFLYLFDFGDDWQFQIKLIERSNTVSAGPPFPRLVASFGPAPEQYPTEEDWDDDDEEDEENDAQS